MSRWQAIDEDEFGRGRKGYEGDADRYAPVRELSRASHAPSQSTRYGERDDLSSVAPGPKDSYQAQSRRYDDPYRRSEASTAGPSAQSGRYGAPPLTSSPSRSMYGRAAAPEPAPEDMRRPSAYEEPRSSRHAPSSYSQAPPSSVASAVVRRSGAAPSVNTSDISESLKKLALTSFYVRPGFGTAGRPIMVLSNYFQVRARDGRGKVIYHYDVDMEPIVSRGANAKKPKGLLRAVWEQLCLEQKGEYVDSFAASAYDGRKNAFTPNKMPFPRDEARTFEIAIAPDGVVQRPGRKEASSSDDENRRWRVTLKLVAEVDLKFVMDFCKADKKAPSGEEECLTGVMATNVLMRDLPSKKFAQVGATGNKFFTMSGAHAISQGAVVCKGFTQSFRYSNSGMPLLNLDVCFSAFLGNGPALDVIARIINRGGPGGRGRGGQPGPPRGHRQDISELSKHEVDMVKRALRGAKFTVTHRDSARLHTVMSVTALPAEQISFHIEGRDGEPENKIYIPEFYQLYHQRVVTKPRLPCIQYGKKAFIPLEFVVLSQWNSLPPTKLNAEQTAEMIKVSAIRPKERADEVKRWRKELDYDTQPKIAAWGWQINNNMVEIAARVLPPPRIVYARGAYALPEDGGWHLRDKQFFRNGKQPLKAWAVISFDKYFDVDEMQRYITYLCGTLRSHGVEVANATPHCVPPVDPRDPRNIRQALQEAARNAFMAGGGIAPQLICCVLPGRDAWLYEHIKKMSFTDLKAPVPTQCMQAAKIRSPRGIGAYTANLVMKIQNKLGGLPHKITFGDLPGMVHGKTMLLGGDIGLPPIRAGNESAPTVACTIATYNAECDAYSAQIRLQEGRGEIIQDLSSMVEAHLKIFHKHNDGHYPERILIFRDGISEGQYAASLHYEHNAVLKACEKLLPGYRPRLLMCICAKRHNTRFFGRENQVDRTGNLPSGLVVDSTVTHPYAFDFFLQAHTGRVGTTRPTHYICLLDELPVTPDQLQQLVHSLCHTFTRCTNSVSLVPVCYIADLVCQKARIVVHEEERSIAPSESSFGKRSATGTSRREGLDIDVMQVQKLMEKNEMMAEVAWWM